LLLGSGGHTKERLEVIVRDDAVVDHVQCFTVRCEQDRLHVRLALVLDDNVVVARTPLQTFRHEVDGLVFHETTVIHLALVVFVDGHLDGLYLDCTFVRIAFLAHDHRRLRGQHDVACCVQTFEEVDELGLRVADGHFSSFVERQEHYLTFTQIVQR